MLTFKVSAWLIDIKKNYVEMHCNLVCETKEKILLKRLFKKKKNYEKIWSKSKNLYH